MRRQIAGFVWLDWVVDKLLIKHDVQPGEVEEAFFNPPYKVRKAESGKHTLYGRSEEGRYLFIVFVWEGNYVRVITARDMTPAERQHFQRK